jgi:hypothetical protein
MGVSPGRVSQMERGAVSTLDSIVRYVEALGGRLDVVLGRRAGLAITQRESGRPG